MRMNRWPPKSTTKTSPLRRRLTHPTVVVALGGNIGTVRQLISRFNAAVRLMVVVGAFDIRASKIYRSSPVGPVHHQPPFLNAVVRLQLHGSISPSAFLVELWRIEAALGRCRPSRPAKGPRTIDLDLIHWNNLKQKTQLLTLPHPERNHRAFVIEPLREVNRMPIAVTSLTINRSWFDEPIIQLT